MSGKLFWTMTKGKVMEGVLAVNKPTMKSSAQIIRDMQHAFQSSKLFAPWIELEEAKIKRESHNQRKRRKQKKVQVKIGHGGTLDPLATGVLITGIGKGTKALNDFLLCTKSYEAVVLFGTSTDSYDRVGKVLRRAPYEHITKELLEKALSKFRGKYMQLPPLFSALKMDGKPLYEYAREGKPLPREIARREVEVLELELVEWMEGDTHPHVAPTEDAGYPEINLATMMWKQEGVLPPGENVKTEPEEEGKKRKLSNDDLVKEMPASKRKMSVSQDDATMSGGLAAPVQEDPEAAIDSSFTVDGDATVPEVEVEPKVKGPPAARIRMTVTSGFYVRSLCHDLGFELGSAALMAELERSRQQTFEIGKNCLEYSDLEKGEEVWGPKVEAMLDAWNEKNDKSGLSAPGSVDAVAAAIRKEVSADGPSPRSAVVDTSPAKTEAELPVQ